MCFVKVIKCNKFLPHVSHGNIVLEWIFHCCVDSHWKWFKNILGSSVDVIWVEWETFLSVNCSFSCYHYQWRQAGPSLASVTHFLLQFFRFLSRQKCGQKLVPCTRVLQGCKYVRHMSVTSLRNLGWTSAKWSIQCSSLSATICKFGNNSQINYQVASAADAEK